MSFVKSRSSNTTFNLKEQPYYIFIPEQPSDALYTSIMTDPWNVIFVTITDGQKKDADEKEFAENVEKMTP